MAVSIEFIEYIVCVKRNINPSDLHVKSRCRPLCEARQIIMFFSLLIGYTLSEAGGYFGRDHATAMHAKNAVNNLIDTNKGFAEDIKMISSLLTEDSFEKHRYAHSVLNRLKKETKELEEQLKTIAI